MNLKEANKKMEQLDNNLKYYTREKDISLKKVGISASVYDKINVSGGKRDDKFSSYMVSLEDKDRLTLIELDKKIVDIKDKINNLSDWIDNELKILKKYRDVEQQVIYYKENERHYTWEEIALRTGFCSRQCQRIYDKYQKERIKQC